MTDHVTTPHARISDAELRRDAPAARAHLRNVYGTLDGLEDVLDMLGIGDAS